jgi:hypothetical protein
MFSEGFLCTCDPDFAGDGYNCTEIEGSDYKSCNAYIIVGYLMINNIIIMALQGLIKVP